MHVERESHKSFAEYFDEKKNRHYLQHRTAYSYRRERVRAVGMLQQSAGIRIAYVVRLHRPPIIEYRLF